MEQNGAKPSMQKLKQHSQHWQHSQYEIGFAEKFLPKIKDWRSESR